ncbi:MAG: hypothetical protein ACTSUS_04575 [Candidatus Freyarchaeota archaeon]
MKLARCRLKRFRFFELVLCPECSRLVMDYMAAVRSARDGDGWVELRCCDLCGKLSEKMQGNRLRPEDITSPVCRLQEKS